MSSILSTSLLNPSSLFLSRSSKLGLVGACLYIAGFALPLPWDIPLLVLALTSILTMLSGTRPASPSWSPITVSVLVFLATIGLSILVSADISRSARLSASFLPGHSPLFCGG